MLVQIDESSAAITGFEDIVRKDQNVCRPVER